MKDSAGRINVVLGVARPNDVVDPLIDLAGAAVQHILRALEQLGGVRLTTPERATEGDLRSALSTSRPNVLHFIGHCRSRATGYGTLVIENSSGKSRSVSAHYMGDILTTAPSLRIVLLQTTREMDLHVDEFAKNFLDRGVQAVVVLQHLDATAGAAFARAFYAALCNGRLIDDAVAAGSRQLKETAGPSPDGCRQTVHKPKSRCGSRYCLTGARIAVKRTVAFEGSDRFSCRCGRASGIGVNCRSCSGWLDIPWRAA
jgi:CHAT domain